MNDYFQYNKRSLFILAALFFILALVLYFILIRPLYDDIQSTEQTVQVREDEIAQLEAQLEQAAVMPEESVEQLLLENRIPLERKLDDYILSLQRLEAATNSKIERIDFVYDSNLEIPEPEEDEESLDEEITTEEVLGEEETDIEEAETEETEEEEITVDPAILQEKPENLDVITVNVTGASEDFEDLIDLLKTVEETERISIVTALRLLQPTEADEYELVENPLENILFEAELTTFYYNK